MIEFLRGKLHHREPGFAVLDINGVGYGINVAGSFEAQLVDVELATEISCWVYTRVKEDLLQLYAFDSLASKKVFTILLKVSGVGPRLAQGILAVLTLETILRAVKGRQVDLLLEIPGIGKRTGEKILVELQGYVEQLESLLAVHGQGRRGEIAEEPRRRRQVFADVQSALRNLGFRDKDTSPLLASMIGDAGLAEESLEELIREALKRLRKRDRSGAEELTSIF